MDCNARISALSLICACFAMVAILLLKRHPNGAVVLLSTLYALFASVAIALNGRLEGSQFQSLCHTTNWESERYFLPGSIVLFYLLIALFDTFRLPRLGSSFLLLAIFIPALVNNFTIGRIYYNSHWSSHAKEINAWLSARKTCQPAAETDVLAFAGWLIILPELRGCHGEVALDGIILQDGTGHNYLADHGSKRLIPDEQTIKVLGVSHVRTMSADDLRKVPTGPPLPSVSTKTIANKVTLEMFVLNGGKRRYIQNTSSLQALGLERPVTVFPEALSNAFPLGRVLEAISNPAAIQLKNGPVFLLYNGTLYEVPDPQTLSSLGFKGQLTIFDEDDLKFLKKGSMLPKLRSNTIQDQATSSVFLLEEGLRRYIPDPQTLDALHRHNSIELLPGALVNQLPEGPPITHINNAAAH